MDIFEQILKPEPGQTPPATPPEEVAQPPVDATAPEPTPEPEKQTPPPPAVDEYSIVSKYIGREVKSEDDITAWRSELEQTTGKLTEYEQKMAALQAERDSLAEAFDPMSLFASPELYTLNGLLKKFPDKNPAVLTEISTKDFSKIAMDNPVEVLALNKMLEHPGVYTSRADAMEDVLADYNIPDMDDVDDKTLRRMKVAASETAVKFGQIKAQIEQPKKVDLSADRAAKVQADEARKNKIKEATEPLFNKVIPETLKAIEFPVTLKGDDGNEVTEVAFKFDIGEGYAKSKFVQTLLETVRNAEIQNATEFTPKRAEELKAQIEELAKANYLYANRKQVYAALRDDIVGKVKDAEWMRRHNPKPLRQDGTAHRTDPATLAADRAQNKIIEGFGITVK